MCSQASLQSCVQWKAITETIDQDLLQSDVEEYTKFLCISAEIHLNASQPQPAQKLFKTATDLMEAQEFSKTTDVYMKWTTVKNLLENLLENSPAK